MLPLLRHEENRKKVCAVCGNKIVFGRKKIEDHLINMKYNDLIKNLINENFSIHNNKFPLSICVTCRLTLSEHDKGQRKRPLPSMPNYSDIQLLKDTRSVDSDVQRCYCYICVTACSTVSRKSVKGRGIIRSNISNKITSANGMYGKKQNSNISQALSSSNKYLRKPITKNSRNVIKLCNTCFHEIKRGISHRCQNKRKNVESLVYNKLSETSQTQIASSIIRRSQKKMSTSKSSKNNVELSLNTRGRRKKIILRSKEKTITFSEENLDRLKSTCGFSKNQMNNLTNFIRSTAGKKSVPTAYREHMTDKATFLEYYYKSGSFQFDVEKGKAKEERTVIWTDAEEIVDVILSERHIIGSYVVKIMADGGQGFFKVCMSIIPVSLIEESANYTVFSDSSDEDNYQPVEKKRKTYCEGGSVSAKSKITSVYRLIMVCIVPDIKETYENIKILFDLIKINNISFKFCSDFKVLLMINGQQTASSSFPCPYCNIQLTSMRSCASSNDVLPLKTYGMLENDYANFCSFGKDKKLAKNCNSVINRPLFIEEKKNLSVLERCVIPELHVLQGFVNHIFWKGLVPLLGREKALIWPKKLKVVPKNYHGEIFEGNACRKLLKESERLFDPEICNGVGKLALVRFVNALKAMNEVVFSCFSMRRQKSCIDALIINLKKSFEATELSTTLKIHVVIEHLEACLFFLDNVGLGVWSEQAGESVHKEFLKYWNKYKINLVTDSSYPERLKKAVVEFSSLHI